MAFLQNILGLLVSVSICFLLSWNKNRVPWMTVVKALVAEFVIAFIIVKIPLGAKALKALSDGITALLNCGADGLEFVFGDLWSGDVYIFIIQSLGDIIFVSALVAVLYYLGVIGFIVKWIGKAVGKIMGTIEVESFVAVANLFLGHTDSPILVTKYLPDLTESEIFVILVSGMGSMSASILIGYTSLGIKMEHLLVASAMVPIGSILVSKIICLQVDTPRLISGVKMDNKGNNGNVIDALFEGANTGMQMVIAIGASLVGFIGMVAVFDLFLGFIPGVDITLSKIFGYIFAPFGWLLGFEGEGIMLAGKMLGDKLILNEFIAYGTLGAQMKAGTISETSALIATISLAGFANLSSMGSALAAAAFCAPRRDPSSPSWSSRLCWLVCLSPSTLH